MVIAIDMAIKTCSNKIVKKIFFLVCCALAIAAFPAYAQENNASVPPDQIVTVAPTDTTQSSNSMIVPPYYPPPQQTFLGEDQSYTVNFRGNGSTVVVMKTVLSNVTDKPLKTIALNFPDTIAATDISAFQLLVQADCIRYRPQPYPPVYQNLSPTPYILPLQNSGNIAPKPIIQLKPNLPICEEYNQPDFNNINSYSTKFQRIEYDLKNGQILLHLSTPIGVNESGSYFVYFRSPSFAHKNLFGAYNFNFETLKTNDNINNLTIGINTDSDYILRDAKGKINYQTNTTTMSLPLGGFSNRTISNNQQVTDFYMQIGQGNITKTANDLASNETYKVSGTYADAQWKLYSNEIFTGLVIFFLILLVIIVVLRILFVRWHKGIKENQTLSADTHNHAVKVFLTSFGLSFASTFLLFFYTIGLFMAGIFFNIFQNNFVVLMCLFAISMAVYMFFLFVPAIIIGIKKGLFWGLNTFGFTIMWSILFLIVLLAVIFIFFSGNNGNGFPYSIMQQNAGANVKLNVLPPFKNTNHQSS